MNASNKPNVKQAVPFFRVSDIERSVHYYINGLGFKMKYNWIDEGKLRWCWLEIGDASLMLQELHTEEPHADLRVGKSGEDVSVYFICEDALVIYNEIISRGIDASEPLVGNNMWVTGLKDPDGYCLYFESPADAPEETTYSEWKKDS